MFKKLEKPSMITAVCLLACLLGASCSGAKAEEYDRKRETIREINEAIIGRISGKSYTNDYFGFEFTIPEGWKKVYSMDEMMKLNKFLNGIDKSNEVSFEGKEVLNIFLAMQSTSPTSSQISIIVELPDNIVTLKEYVEKSIADIKDTNLFSAIKEVKLGNKSVICVESTTIKGNSEKAYCFESNGYMGFISTIDNKENDSIENFIKSIKFK